MIYPRDLIEKVKLFLKRKEFIAIIGTRQSGKTVLSGLMSYMNV